MTASVVKVDELRMGRLRELLGAQEAIGQELQAFDTKNNDVVKRVCEIAGADAARSYQEAAANRRAEIERRFDEIEGSPLMKELAAAEEEMSRCKAAEDEMFAAICRTPATTIAGAAAQLRAVLHWLDGSGQHKDDLDVAALTNIAATLDSLSSGGFSMAAE